MSIYASLGAPNDDHAEGCAYWVEWVETPPGSGCFEAGRDEDCTCKLRHAPIVYKGSHILPSMDDERGGWIDLALIPGFITRTGREDEQPDNDEHEDYPAAWPYLRFGVNGTTVVLDKAGVQQVADTLAYWLSRVEPTRLTVARDKEET